LKNLKERYKRTVERKFKDGEFLIFHREKGIINEDTNEVVVDLKSIIECGAWDPSSNQDEIDDEINSNIKEEHDFSDSEEGEGQFDDDSENEQEINSKTKKEEICKKDNSKNSLPEQSENSVKSENNIPSLDNK
jgi:hypothetical protein